MSILARPAVPQDFPIQVAENEGMPSRTDPRDTALRVTRHGRQTGTLRPGSSKERTAADEVWAAKGARMRKTNTTATARLVSRLAVVAGIMAAVAFPVFAQDGTGPTPDNAKARNYGGGWDCSLGYRVNGADCASIGIPENAYATGRSYGSGWACRRGYAEVAGTSCEAIPIPDNAYLRSSGYDWQCDRGYRRDRDACVPIALPENGYLTNSDYGAKWICERGFFKVDDRCAPVALPANAFLDQESYGPGWKCERGFEAVKNTCVAIDLPANAHVDRSGNGWRCDRSFQLSDGECVLGQ